MSDTPIGDYIESGAHKARLEKMLPRKEARMTITTEEIMAAVEFSRNFATAKPNIASMEREHILGLCSIIERICAAPPFVVTDELVEKAAMAVERMVTADGYGWTDEQFDAWWNSDPLFCEQVNSWAGFTGTRKQKRIRETRAAIEAVLGGGALEIAKLEIIKEQS